ncbi:hypothetical protein ACI3ER_11340 [Bacillus sp. Wb]
MDFKIGDQIQYIVNQECITKNRPWHMIKFNEDSHPYIKGEVGTIIEIDKTNYYVKTEGYSFIRLIPIEEEVFKIFNKEDK